MHARVIPMAGSQLGAVTPSTYSYAPIVGELEERAFPKKSVPTGYREVPLPRKRELSRG